MLNSIHISSQIVNKVKQLQRSTAKGKQALDHYEKIVELMRNNGFDNIELLSKRTRSGELRIQNCIKYDLGAGYRLISIKKDNQLFLQFLGSHDEADGWLNLNKGFIPCHTGNCYPLNYTIDTTIEQSQQELDEPENLEDEYEERLLNALDDKLLQQIFSGICEQR